LEPPVEELELALDKELQAAREADERRAKEALAEQQGEASNDEDLDDFDSDEGTEEEPETADDAHSATDDVDVDDESDDRDSPEPQIDGKGQASLF
jgi:hypothetical protein